MEVAYLQQAQDDILYWKKSGSKRIQKKIDSLIDDIKEGPFAGKGKPEALKYEHSGKWSRRIDNEHRIIYEVEEEKIFIHSLRGHYTQ